MLSGLLADKGEAAQISTAMRVLAEIIASDVSLLVTFNHAIDVIQDKPESRANEAETILLVCLAALGVENATDIFISYHPARTHIANPSTVRGNRRKFIFVNVRFHAVYLDI